MLWERDDELEQMKNLNDRQGSWTVFYPVWRSGSGQYCDLFEISITCKTGIVKSDTFYLTCHVTITQDKDVEQIKMFFYGQNATRSNLIVKMKQ